ncbi:hypothetical protein [Oceanobacillus damuensis]|uniref:hypothetical protein n=1 Tax=Oceanobacillus damuensis TaxID=937928 RepID=UPI00082D33F1|nr:hypothetical protein [Oceanobacillus damuensis]
MSQAEFNQLIKRFDKLEDMMAQLINTVGNVMEEQTSMKNEINSIKDGQTSMKDEISSIKDGQTSLKDEISSIKDGQASMKAENETRHQEVMEQLSRLKADQDLIWDKSTKNEREIGIVKKLYDF